MLATVSSRLGDRLEWSNDKQIAVVWLSEGDVIDQHVAAVRELLSANPELCELLITNMCKGRMSVAIWPEELKKNIVFTDIVFTDEFVRFCGDNKLSLVLTVYNEL
jgi:hypothetical protein